MRILKRDIKSIPTEKACSACTEIKPLSEFHQNSRYLYGVTGQCKACRNAAVRLYGKHNGWINRQSAVHPEIKKCSKCKEDKKAAAFTSCPSKKGGLSSWCKDCRNSATRRNGGPEGKLKARIRTLYGLTMEQYRAIIEMQSSLCAICKTTLNHPVVDHCHKGHGVRGILCNPCNRRLWAIENEDFKARAESYLMTFSLRGGLERMTPAQIKESL